MAINCEIATKLATDETTQDVTKGGNADPMDARDGVRSNDAKRGRTTLSALGNRCSILLSYRASAVESIS